MLYRANTFIKIRQYMTKQLHSTDGLSTARFCFLAIPLTVFTGLASGLSWARQPMTVSTSPPGVCGPRNCNPQYFHRSHVNLY